MSYKKFYIRPTRIRNGLKCYIATHAPVNIDGEIHVIEHKACEVLKAQNDIMREALSWYRLLPMSEQNQLWTQELADQCILMAKQALAKCEALGEGKEC